MDRKRELSPSEAGSSIMMTMASAGQLMITPRKFKTDDLVKHIDTDWPYTPIEEHRVLDHRYSLTRRCWEYRVSDLKDTPGSSYDLEWIPEEKLRFDTHRVRLEKKGRLYLVRV